MNSNQKKDATLGMPHGTAQHRLRKSILFFLLKKHGENICFKCSGLIERVEDLSVEHKKPWEGISAELFWDIENIAFSHLRCNRPNRLGMSGPAQRKVGPEGTSWCYEHREFLPVDKFYKDPYRWNGIRGRCIECHNSRSR
jgi:hypothetical protein